MSSFLKTAVLVVLGSSVTSLYAAPVLAAPVAAESSAATAAPTVGIISMQEIILSVPEGKAARAALEKEVKEKDAYFIKEKKELERQDAELLKQRSLLSEEARTEKQMEFQKKVLAHRREEEEFQQKLKQKEIEATQKIASKAAKIVESLALKHHLAEVREASQSGLVYIRNHLDLTKEVIAAYDAQPEAKKDAAKPAAKP